MGDKHQFWATIDDDDPRAADWQAVFGTLTVPIESPEPHWGHLPGYDQPERVFMLAWWLLPADQIARLTRHISQKFSLSEPEVTAQLARHGVPILAHNVTVAIPPPPPPPRPR